MASAVKDKVDELNRVVRTVGEHSHLMATEAKRDLKETMRAAEEQAATERAARAATRAAAATQLRAIEEKEAALDTRASELRE